MLGRTETRTRERMTVRRYEQLETSPETVEQELRPAVCEYRQTDRLKENYNTKFCYNIIYYYGPIQVLRNADGGGWVSDFPGKKRYEGVMFNVINVTRGRVGVQFAEK